MKIPYIQISFFILAIGLAFTAYWQWTSVILITLYAYRKDKQNPQRISINNLDKFI